MACELYRVPLAEVLVDAKHGDHSHFELVVVRVTNAAGEEGVGYTYTGGKGGLAIKAMVEADLAPCVTGEDAGRIERLYDSMTWHVHYVARGGVASFAISAVDIALWDLKGKRAGEPLWRMLGGFDSSTRCYAGGIDLAYDEAKLLSGIQSNLAKGFQGIKIKLGRPTLEEDIARVAAVRKLIGPDRMLAVDANYSWSVEKSVRAAKLLAEHNVLWLEEPTLPDDFEGYARIREEGGLAIAQGENLHTLHEFTHALTRGKVDFPQPDASNIGGVTGWVKVANLAQALNLPVCSHGMQELHVSLMSAMPNSGWMEVHSFPIDQYTTRPLRIDPETGRALAPDTPGTGVHSSCIPCELLHPVLNLPVCSHRSGVRFCQAPAFQIHATVGRVVSDKMDSPPARAKSASLVIVGIAVDITQPPAHGDAFRSTMSLFTAHRARARFETAHFAEHGV